MTTQAWRALVQEAVERDASGDASMLDTVVALLEEQDKARQMLRDMGVGWIGRPLLEMLADCEAKR